VRRIYARFLSAFLRTFFDLLYHQFAWSYDLVAAVVSLGMWKDWVLSIVPEVGTGRALELGQGPGHLQAALSQSGTPVIGLDESKQMGRLAKRRLRRLGLPSQLVNGDAQTLPFPNASFQQVIATFPSEYIANPETLKEIYRVLQPEGNLLVLPVAWITGRGRLHRAAAWLFRVTGQAGEWDDRYTQPLRKAGFAVRVKRKKLRFSMALILEATKEHMVL
jgi:ubiquinone/menaquinone biosynthesis C-methylase UbiE